MKADPARGRFDDVLGTVGGTPLVRLRRVVGDVRTPVWAKVESFNPLASVKDRLAHAIITDAEKRGVIEPGQTVVEATSGNTGIALAMVCARLSSPSSSLRCGVLTETAETAATAASMVAKVWSIVLGY